MKAIAGATAAMTAPNGGFPAGAPIAQQPEDYGKNNRNLPEQLVNAITEVIKEAQQEDRWWRLQEVLRASLCRYYDLGIQHLWCDGFNWSQATPGQSYTNGDGEVDSFPDYIGDYNIFTAFAQILQAKISEPDIGIDFQPIRPDRSVDRQAAEAANAIRTQADIDRDPHEVMTEKIYFLEMDGAAVTWAGTRDQQDDFGGEDGPRRVTFREVGGVLEWKRPLFAQSLGEWWYVIHYRDTDIRVAKEKFDWIADELEGGQPCLAESSYERLHRLAMVQSAQRRGLGIGSGASIEHLITEGDIWLRPCAFVNKKDAFLRRDGNYEEVSGDDGGTRYKTVYEKLKELFPQGMHATCVGQKYAESREDDPMDQCLSECHAYVGKGQTRYPIMYPIVLNQDGFNQTVNYIRENNDFGAPATWVNSQYCDYAAISKQASRPGAFHELKNLPGGAIAANMIYREPQIQIPGGFLDFAAEFLMGSLAQFQLACPPSVWGAPQAGNDTAEGMRLAASQALGILGKLRTRIINSDAEDYKHICMAVSRDTMYPEKMTIQGQTKGRTKIISKGALTRGNFRAFPDKDSGFPESTASMRQQMERTITMLAPTNLGMEIMSDPRNAAEYMRVNGVKLEIRAATAWDKQSREIEELIESRPILTEELVALLDSGAGVQAMLDAVKQAILTAQQGQLQQAQAAWNSPQNPAMIAHAAAALAAKAQNLPEPPVPPMPPPPPFDPLTIARSSVPVNDSDFHQDEAMSVQYWLSGDECATELDVDDMGEEPPNVPGVLNVQLHRLEHLLKEPPPPQLPAPPMKGPQPAVGSPPKMEPMPAGA